jgi:hypothetical protein
VGREAWTLEQEKPLIDHRSTLFHLKLYILITG